MSQLPREGNPAARQKRLSSSHFALEGFRRWVLGRITKGTDASGFSLARTHQGQRRFTDSGPAGVTSSQIV